MKDVNARLEEVRESFRREGRLLPGGLENVRTAKGTTLTENLGDEDMALLLPSATLRTYTGSYQHLRAAAETICTSELRKSLPPAWQDLHECPIVKADETSSGERP